MRMPARYGLRVAGSRGFSLVETLVATGILASAVTGTLGLLAASMSASQDGHLRSRALTIAQQVCNDLKTGSAAKRADAQDERLTRYLRPVLNGTMPRAVLFWDDAGFAMPMNAQPAPNQGLQVYELGSRSTAGSWLVSIAIDEVPALRLAGGSGQVVLPEGQSLDAVKPLGGKVYDYAPQAQAVGPDEAPPAAGVSRVTVSVETPPGASRQNRKKFRYDFLWQP